MTSPDTLANYVAKPAISFAIGSALAAYVRPDTDVKIFGTSMPAWVLGGIAAFVSAEVEGLAHDYLWPHVTELTLLNAPMNTAANVAIHAATSALVYNTLLPGSLKVISVPELVAAGAIQEVGSSYITQTWVKPWYEGKNY